MNETFGKIHKTLLPPMAFCPLLIIGFVILTLVGCDSRAKLSALTKEAESQQKAFIKTLTSLDTVAAGNDKEKNDSDQVNAATEKKIIDWSSPKEVSVVLQSVKEEIDTSPGAKKISNTLRANGITKHFTGIISAEGATVGTQEDKPCVKENLPTSDFMIDGTPVSNGMKYCVSDKITFASGGSGESLVWDTEKIKGIIILAGELKGKFSKASENLKQIGSDDNPMLAEKCDSGVNSVQQIMENAKAILVLQEASSKNAKPNEKMVQDFVTKMLKARLDLRELTASYDLLLKEFTDKAK